jgi:hypothetical protein
MPCFSEVKIVPLAERIRPLLKIMVFVSAAEHSMLDPSSQSMIRLVPASAFITAVYSSAENTPSQAAANLPVFCL